jgi:hypothetical protein
MITGAAGTDRDPEGGRMPDRIRNPTSRRAEDKAKRAKALTQFVIARSPQTRAKKQSIWLDRRARRSRARDDKAN